MQIPLKQKYLTARKSRYGSSHQDSYKKVKRVASGQNTVKYDRDNHVLYITGGHRVFLHYADARKVLGR